MKLSIIIPVYNVETYVEDCICSCIENIGKNTDNVEVIVVNDGSQDRSIDIINNLIKDYSYFHIISQRNQGLSIARNNGMKAAKGDYIWFVDSDDYIRKGIVNVFLEQLNINENLDMIELKSRDVEESVSRKNFDAIESGIPASYRVISGRKRFVEGFNVCVPFHIFRRRFLEDNNLRMYPNIYYEDCEFTPRVLWLANEVLIINEEAYFYRHRCNSIKTTPNPQKGVDSIFVSKRLQDFFLNQRMSAPEKTVVYGLISMFYCNGLNMAVGSDSKAKCIIGDQATINSSVLDVLKQSQPIKYRVLGYLGSLIPRRILEIYLVMMKFKFNK